MVALLMPVGLVTPPKKETSLSNRPSRTSPQKCVVRTRSVRKPSATCTLDQSVQVHPCCDSRPISSADKARHCVVMGILSVRFEPSRLGQAGIGAIPTLVTPNAARGRGQLSILYRQFPGPALSDGREYSWPRWTGQASTRRGLWTLETTNRPAPRGSHPGASVIEVTVRGEKHARDAGRAHKICSRTLASADEKW